MLCRVSLALSVIRATFIVFVLLLLNSGVFTSRIQKFWAEILASASAVRWWIPCQAILSRELWLRALWMGRWQRASRATFRQTEFFIQTHTTFIDSFLRPTDNHLRHRADPLHWARLWHQINRPVRLRCLSIGWTRQIWHLSRQLRWDTQVQLLLLLLCHLGYLTQIQCQVQTLTIDR